MTMDERIEFLMQSIESHDRQIGELTDRMSQTDRRIAATTANIDKLVAASNEDAISIRTLARIAEAHEGRIAGLEGGTQQ